MKRTVLTWMLVSSLAGLAGCQQNAPDKVAVAANSASRDGAARTQMRTIYRAEESFKARTGKYGTIEELVKDGDLNTDPTHDRLFRFSVSASEDRFECTGVPIIYRTNGVTSLYIDQTGKLRGADRGGSSARADDPIIDE